jgi:uncharacterized DUF497 family protein
MNIPQKLCTPDREFRLVIGHTKIEYGDKKECSNRKDHKYSLESAVLILRRLLVPSGHVPYIISDAYMEKGEVRHMHMSLDDSDHVVLMVTTMRPNETIRIISFRPASEQERKLFHTITAYGQAR